MNSKDLGVQIKRQIQPRWKKSRWTRSKPRTTVAAEVLLGKGADEESVFDYPAWMVFQTGRGVRALCQTWISSAGQRARVAWVPIRLLYRRILRWLNCSVQVAGGHRCWQYQLFCLMLSCQPSRRFFLSVFVKLSNFAPTPRSWATWTGLRRVVFGYVLFMKALPCATMLAER